MKKSASWWDLHLKTIFGSGKSKNKGRAGDKASNFLNV
jgi:hypothetical protein